MEAEPEPFGVATTLVGGRGTGLTNTERELDTGDIPDAFVAVVVNV